MRRMLLYWHQYIVLYRFNNVPIRILSIRAMGDATLWFRSSFEQMKKMLFICAYLSLTLCLRLSGEQEHCHTIINMIQCAQSCYFFVCFSHHYLWTRKWESTKASFLKSGQQAIILMLCARKVCAFGKMLVYHKNKWRMYHSAERTMLQRQNKC